MIAIYRSLLHLYPAAYREEYANEMMTVFDEVEAEMENKSTLARALSLARETGGLLRGAMRENVRSIFGPYGGSTFSSFSRRRPTMRSEFRFPKATVTLMVIILADVMVAIDKARSIEFSVPHVNPPVGPIHSAQFTILASLALALVLACLAGAIGWAVIFALRRSGLHRLSEVDASSGQRSSTKLPV
jgi:hypothetical protein